MSEAQNLATKRMEEIRDLYRDTSKGENFSAIVTGEAGVGKTSLICTGRRPILIDSFDPRGTVAIEVMYPDEVKKGTILIRPFWDESYKAPQQHGLWEDMWEDDIKSGFLSNFGTYAIDSVSTFLDALSWRVSKKKGRPDGTLAIQDYIPIYNTMKDVIKISAAQECDFILTGHLIIVRDDITGEVKSELDAYVGLRTKIPLLFTEKYVIYVKQTSSGNKHILLTQGTSRYRASTQLGAGGKFEAEEDPNIKALLEKAGRKTDDKPLLTS